jgi:hypothetical protein
MLVKSNKVIDEGEMGVFSQATYPLNHKLSDVKIEKTNIICSGIENS